MTVIVNKTKALKFQKAGLIGNCKLYVQRKPIKLVRSFKYVGIVMQPALGFSERIEQLQTGTATIATWLGNLQKLPLDLAMKIFEIRVMPSLRYGMNRITAPKRP